MTSRLSFSDLVNGTGPSDPDPESALVVHPSREGGRAGHPLQPGGQGHGPAPTGDVGVLVFAGETWNVIVAEAKKCGMSPEAMVSRALAEFVSRRAIPEPAQSTARTLPRVEKIR